jgi:membrane-associated phospholipid phosphatase
VNWMPYQRPTFVTPAFPGFVSGHSTFSRAAAEVLAAYTGSPFFPGGMWEQTFTPGALKFEHGPSVPLTLQWATYYDASDQAGISRLYGGIHISADDLEGRRIGSQVGKGAWALAQRYFAGTARP